MKLSSQSIILMKGIHEHPLLRRQPKDTSGMINEAAALGKWQMPGSQRKYPVMQIFTVEEYFDKRMPDLPDTSETIKRAKREVRESEKQRDLDL